MYGINKNICMTEQKQKILIINYLFPPLGGGGGVASYTIAKGFIKAGYDVDYITTQINSLPAHEIIDGISVYRVSIWGTRATFPASMVSLILFPIVSLWKGLQLCFKNKYSYINSHFVLPAGPLGFVLSKLFSIPHIMSIHGGDIYDPTRKRSPHQYWIPRKIIRFLLNHADSVVAQSSNTKENCMRYYKPQREIKIISLPYDIVPFKHTDKKNLGLHEEKKYIIGVGMLVKRKAFDIFIRALAKLDDSVEGIILGDGPELPYLQSLARELGVLPRIHFVGRVQGEKKFQYLSCSDVFVLSSVHEGFGIVLQEAMQVGLPIVATNNGGQTDFVIDGKNGFLVSPEDAGAITDKINIILSSQEIITSMKSSNLEAIKKFSSENIISQLLHI